MRRIAYNDTDLFKIQEEMRKVKTDSEGRYRVPQEVIMRNVKRKRTLSQNSGYWVWLTYLADRLGETKENLHEFFLDKFPTYEMRTIMGIQQRVRIRTSDMTLEQMSRYMENVQIFCHTELGEPLPDLGTQEFERMVEYYIEKGEL